MKRRFRRGIASPAALAATVLIGFAGVLGFLVIPAISEPVANMYIEPAGKTVPVGETFTVKLMVRSTVPTNVFAGELLFNNEILEVDSISYNTSIADLWAEQPWYSNGDGTLTFAGGTTKAGGFIGNDALLTVTFQSLAEGAGTLQIKKSRIFRHDGFGTEIALPEPLDTVFTVEMDELPLENVVSKDTVDAPIQIVKTAPSTDLNGDGKQSVADVSIFMLHIGGNDPKYDFNLDGSVNIKDLGIIMSAK